MHKCTRPTLTLTLLLLLLTSAAAFAVPPEDLSSPSEPALPRELIVLLDNGPNVPTPEAVVEHAKGRRPIPGDLGEGGPSEARLVIPPVDRRELQGSDAGERLLRYVVMSYPVHVNIEAVEAALEYNPNVLWVD